MKFPFTNRFFLLPLRVLILSCILKNGLVAQESVVDFSRDVRPILSNACFHCHGPDEDARQAELRLDQQQGLFEDRGGYVAVKPGLPAGSDLIRRILSSDPDEVMPPPDSNKVLTAEQRQVLLQWVKQGAEWEQHWAFNLPLKSVPPTVQHQDWCRNEIDRFVLRRMQTAGLEPSRSAPPHILLRRLYLDLIGLPPTIEEADKWLSQIWGSSFPDSHDALNELAYQQLIDELLASPHYGERWARRWLDLARYADTNGYEKDRDRSIWPYRDWVVNAINSDMPFDRFTVEQLAGDMLPNATASQRVATGFHRNTMLNEEGGIDPLEFRYHAMTDRVATTGTTWLGLTLGCCQCHTHKYDPVSHHEYFQIFAYLNNADEPSFNLPDEKVEQTWAANRAKADRLLAQLAENWPVDEFETIALKDVTVTVDGDQSVHVTEDQSVQVTGANPESSVYVVNLAVEELRFDSLRLETSAVARSKGPGRTKHGNFVLSEISIELLQDGRDATPLQISSATASVEQVNYQVSKAFDGNDSTGWAVHGPSGVPKSATATFQIQPLSEKLDISLPATLRVTMKQTSGDQHTIGRFRISPQRKRSDDEIKSQRKERLMAAFELWRQAEVPNAVHWRPFVPTEATANLPTLTIQDDHSIFASGDTAKRDDYEVTLSPTDHPVTALRLEALPDDRLPAGGPGSTYYEGTIGDFYLTEITATVGDRRIPFASASHTFAKNRYGNNPASAALAIDGDVQTGWAVHGRQGERHVAVFNLAEAVPANAVIKIHMSFGRHFASSLGRFRFSATDASSQPKARLYDNDIADVLNTAGDQLNPAESRLLLNTFLLQASELAPQTEQIRQLRARPETTSTLVLQERPAGQTRPTFRHHRGEYLQPRDAVDPRLPTMLVSENSPQPKNRLEFAKWLVSDANPLTARVVVNRHWAAFFGTGLVKTLDDFGLQGEAPSHPELLDWLAVTLSQDDQWSLRRLHRRIVSSATYRQESRVNPDASRIDPENRLLSYAPRYRLDAEVIRDQLLVAANVLSPKLGGPPVRPLQPGGVTEAAYGNPKWKASSGSDRYRRSLYTYTKRTAPFAMLSTFDAPSGEACIARRNRSNSPLQALTLLNDVMLMDLARQAGKQLNDAVVADNYTPQLIQLFRRTVVRPPTTVEVTLLEEFFRRQLDEFLADHNRAARFLAVDKASGSSSSLAHRAAWSATVRAVFGLDESLTRE